MGSPVRIGLVTYTNLTSGIGCFGYDFWRCLEADSILSVASREKGQEVWTDRQLTSRRPPPNKDIVEYLDTYEPQVVLFLETPFNDAIYPLARERGIKTVAIPMHETFSSKRLAADLLICPSVSAWEKAKRRNKILLFLPIGIEMFPFRLRTGHTFVMNIGFAHHADRRQSRVVVEAFQRLKHPNAKLILYCQEKWPSGCQVDDPRIEYNLGSSPHPRDNYRRGDILLAPMAFEGYGRTVLEGMASGMPVVTTDADPMNLFQHDPDFLIKPCRQYNYSGQWVQNTLYNQISVDDMLAKMEWLMTIDTAKYSVRARRQAEAQSWECKDINYRQTWWDVLKALCESG